MKYILSIAFILSLVGNADATLISAQEAVVIAKVEAAIYNYDVADSCIAVIRNETFEDFWGPSPQRSKRQLEIEKRIHGKDFWAVSFYRKRGGNDGRITLYIDASSKEILGYYPISFEELLAFKKEHDTELFLGDAVKKADAELIKLDYDLNKFAMLVLRNDLSFLDSWPSNNVLQRIGIGNIKSIISNRNYWLIYYQPKGEYKEGDICIFIDAITGDIIGMYR